MLTPRKIPERELLFYTSQLAKRAMEMGQADSAVTEIKRIEDEDKGRGHEKGKEMAHFDRSRVSLRREGFLHQVYPRLTARVVVVLSWNHSFFLHNTELCSPISSVVD